MMRWSWTGPGGKPVYNFRSDGRRFPIEQRVLAICDGFYEFTASNDPKAKREDKWLLTMPGVPLFAIAATWRPASAAGEDAWSMLTTEPGPEVVLYRGRQIMALAPDHWRPWLEGSTEAELLIAGPAGTLKVEQVQGGAS